jgi:hypothetical protein
MPPVKPELIDCHDCCKTIPCRCGRQPDGSYRYDKDHSHYMLGATRCGPCRERFDTFNRSEAARKFAAQREAYAAHVNQSRQTDECPDDGILCPSCCPHEDVKNGLCNDCEENVMGDTIDAACAVFESER